MYSLVFVFNHRRRALSLFATFCFALSGRRPTHFRLFAEPLSNKVSLEETPPFLARKRNAGFANRHPTKADQKQARSREPPRNSPLQNKPKTAGGGGGQTTNTPSLHSRAPQPRRSLVQQPARLRKPAPRRARILELSLRQTLRTVDRGTFSCRRTSFRARVSIRKIGIAAFCASTVHVRLLIVRSVTFLPFHGSAPH